MYSKHAVDRRQHPIMKNETILGFTPAESNTFKVIFSHPDGISASVLSKMTGQPRGTTYGHLETLLNKGLITKTLKDSTTLFAPESLEVVEKIYDEEMSELEKEKTNLKNILKRETGRSLRNPKFTVFEGKNVAERYFKEILRSEFKEMAAVWPAEYMAKHVPADIMRSFQENRIKAGKKLRALWPEKEVVDLMKYPQLGSTDSKKSLREIRILPKHIDHQTAFIIYGTKVTFLSPKSEYYGFTIDSIELSNTLLSQFEHLWSISKKYN